ncbi:hypothetical protein IFM12276_10280 [Nocardia sputorum]|uniref:Uncharacterized protein n=1 Tax=Nocardia sputorum TaxID=2984338 RepID=A0ABM8CSX2_9NOCA|nr:hypothetical protein IFM12276_10280 [Nocardia sputorum]
MPVMMSAILPHADHPFDSRRTRARRRDEVYGYQHRPSVLPLPLSLQDQPHMAVAFTERTPRSCAVDLDAPMVFGCGSAQSAYGTVSARGRIASGAY